MDVSLADSAETADSLELGTITDPEAEADVEVSVWSLPNADTYPWSIELLHIRQRRDRLSINCWRVFREPGHEPHYDRHWVSVCYIVGGSSIDGIYKDGDRNGEGGHGNYNLWRYTAQRYIGQFTESITDVSTDKLTTSNRFRSAPLEWIWFSSDREKKVLDWLKSDHYSPDPGMKYWPRKVKHKLLCALGDYESLGWFAQLGMGTAIYDLTIPHALEKIRRERLRKRNSDEG